MKGEKMKKKVAKVFKKHGKGKVKILKEYHPKIFKKGETTVAITASRMNFNTCIANILLKGNKEEQNLVGNVMKTNFYEDRENGKIVKFCK